jgi:NADPH-dependent curcumin reductase CurA
MADRPDLGRALHLQVRPSAALGEEHLAVVEIEMPRLRPGTALVENTHLAMAHGLLPSAVRSWALHTPVQAGPAIGEVIASRSAALPPGTLIRHHSGWASHTVVAPGQHGVRVLDRDSSVPAHAFLGFLGPEGTTGYAGTAEVARVMPGETVLIVPGDGYTGFAAAITARARGAATVIGGLDTCGINNVPSGTAAIYDCRVDSRGPRFGDSLLAAARHGVDAAVVRGAGRLGAVLPAMSHRGRIALTSEVGADPRSGLVLGNRELVGPPPRPVTLIGFRTTDYLHLSRRAEEFLIPALRDGQLVEPDPVACSFADLGALLARAFDARRISPVVLIS